MFYVIYDIIGDLYYNRIDKCLKPLKQTTAIYSTIRGAKSELSFVQEKCRKEMYRNQHNIDKYTPIFYSMIKDYHPELNLVIRELNFKIGKIVYDTKSN